MIIKDYITSKCSDFDAKLSESTLFDISLSIGLDEELTLDNRNGVLLLLLKSIIPILKTGSWSISEDGFSRSESTNKDSYANLMGLYASLCKELGVDDIFNQKPKVTFL